MLKLHNYVLGSLSCNFISWCFGVHTMRLSAAQGAQMTWSVTWEEMIDIWYQYSNPRQEVKTHHSSIICVFCAGKKKEKKLESQNVEELCYFCCPLVVFRFLSSCHWMNLFPVLRTCIDPFRLENLFQFVANNFIHTWKYRQPGVFVAE